jgi:hypothetical protein
VFPPVLCTPVMERGDIIPRFTDDVIFDSKKRGLFQLVVLLDNSEDVEGAQEELNSARETQTEESRLEEATYIITQPSANKVISDKWSLGENIARIFFQNEFTPDLLSRYSTMKGYDGNLLRKEVKGKYVLLRPDRFIFADCGGFEELVKASKRLGEVTQGAATL